MVAIWTICAWCGSGLLVFYSLMQLTWLIELYRRYQQPVELKGPYLKSAVALTLRGADPFLRNCLAGLMSQDHPDYCIVVMIDSTEDPATGLVKQILKDYPSDKVLVRYVTAPRMTCSLKMEALIQIVEQLDPSYEAVVICDADTIPHSSWLRELVGVLNDPHIGVASGIRWYMPMDKAWGSLVRHVWNFGATLQMSAFDIGWGGSLAIRRKSMQQINLLDQWGQAMFEDTLTVSRHLDSNWKLAFVPTATMINRESIDLRSCISFITRQLLNAWLYHKNWKCVIGSATLVAIALTLSFLLVGAGAIIGSPSIVMIAALAILFYAGTNIVSVVSLERQIRRLMRTRSDSPSPIPLRIFAAAALTQFVYLYCIYRALRTRSLEWRGLKYEIAGPWQVRLLEYKPYIPHTMVDSVVSL
ncbi:MAG: glycosyltransferase family 2 protein [Planctomycetota bacterium]|nr:glycosyltransferase family 2 protein [Planctomycetota bacterium]MDA1214984.1 glycosyltransferase family 2 protein [Planctomycetota bacterium]